MVRIEVTEQDIEQGVAGDCENCPAALAINRALKPDFSCDLDCEFVSIFGGPGAPVLNVATPLIVRTFIERFDDYSRVSPFSFELPIDDYCRPEPQS